MKILVCVKPVKAELVALNERIEDPLTLNPYDNFALQDIIRVKKELHDSSDPCEITCMAMGAMSCKDVLTKCVAYGADKAVLLSDKRFGGADTVATTYTMHKFVEKTDVPSLIVCGQKSIDGETGQVVYGLAKRLNISCVVNVNQIIRICKDHIVVQVSDESEMREVKVKLPALIAYNNFTIRQPAFSLLKLKQAKRKEIEVLNMDDISAEEYKCGTAGSRTKVINVVPNITKKTDKQVVVEQSDEINVILELIGKHSMKGAEDESGNMGRL